MSRRGSRGQPVAGGAAARRWLAAGLCSVAAWLPIHARAAETVVIAAEDDWAPYSSAQPGRAGPQGFAVDLVREAFASQGIVVRFELVPFGRCMFLARTGAAAGCFNASPTAENQDQYHWHATPMFREDLAIFGLATDARTGLGLQDLEGKTVGHTLGYMNPDEFTANPRIRRRSAKSDALLLMMLAAGRVDYILMDAMPGALRIARDPSLRGRIKPVGSISTNGFWVAFSRSRPDGRHLADTFERGLAALKASGRYQALDQAFRRRIAP